MNGVHPIFGQLLDNFQRANLQKIDFTCRVCGKLCDVAPNPPDRAVCPEHCDDHDYIYYREERTHYCKNCGQEPPADWWEL